MTVKELEDNVMVRIKEEFGKCCTSDEVNKVYRQARNWVRFHCYFGKYFGENNVKEYPGNLNTKIKQMRWDRLEFLGYEVPRRKK